MSSNSLANVLLDIRKNGVYPVAIVGWRDTIGKQGKRYALYGISHKSDVPKPPYDAVQARKDANKRYREKHLAAVQMRNLKTRGSAIPGNPFAQLYVATGTLYQAAKMEGKRVRSEAPDSTSN